MKISDYIFTTHARERMSDRGISVEEVRLVMNEPDWSYPGTKGDMSHIKRIKGRNIRVVSVGENPQKIITVMVVGSSGETK
jgi:hypothetical protein